MNLSIREGGYGGGSCRRSAPFGSLSEIWCIRIHVVGKFLLISSVARRSLILSETFLYVMPVQALIFHTNSDRGRRAQKGTTGSWLN